MKITVNRSALADAFAIASPLASKNSPKEVLQYLLLRADSKRVSLMATDTECSIDISVPGCQVKATGDALLHVTRMGQILRESTDESLDLFADVNKMVVKGQNCKFSLPMPGPAEYPKPDMQAPNIDYQVSASTLRTLLHRTGFCTNESSARFALGGVLLEPTGDNLLAVATDGRRLAMMRGQLASTQQPPQASRVILPAKGLMLIQRMLDKWFRPDDVLAMSVKDNSVTLAASAATIVTRQLEGRFPNWQQVVPQSRLNDPAICMPVGPFYAAVRQAAIVSDTETHAVDLEFSQEKLTLCASAKDVGQSRVELPITNVQDAAAIKVKLDYSFLVECLRVLDSGSICYVNVQSSSTPILVTTADGYLYLMMPMAM